MERPLITNKMLHDYIMEQPPEREVNFLESTNEHCGCLLVHYAQDKLPEVTPNSFISCGFQCIQIFDKTRGGKMILYELEQRINNFLPNNVWQKCQLPTTYGELQQLWQ